MSTALATQTNSDTAALLQENMGDMAITAQDLIQVKVPAGGGTTWEIPTGEGDDTEAVKVIEGIIIAQMPLRLAFNDDKQLVCKSEDGKVGMPTSDINGPRKVNGLTPSGSCASCPLNAWGSKGGGKACGDKMVLYIIRDGDVLPLTIQLPPTSLSAWRQYTLMLSTRIRKPFYGLNTRITLKKIVKEEKTYSIVQFAPGETIDDLDGVRAFKDSLMFMLKASAAQKADNEPAIQSGMSDEEFTTYQPTTKHAAAKASDDSVTF